MWPLQAVDRMWKLAANTNTSSTSGRLWGCLSFFLFPFLSSLCQVSAFCEGDNMVSQHGLSSHLSTLENSPHTVFPGICCKNTHTHSAVLCFLRRDQISHRYLTPHLLSSPQYSTFSLKQGLLACLKFKDHWNLPRVEDYSASQQASCHRGVWGWSFTFSLLCLSFHHCARGLARTGWVYCYLGVRVCQLRVRFRTPTWTRSEKYRTFLRYGRVNKTPHTWAARGELSGLRRRCWILWCSNLSVTCACVLRCTHAGNKRTSRLMKKQDGAEHTSCMNEKSKALLRTVLLSLCYLNHNCSHTSCSSNIFIFFKRPSLFSQVSKNLHAPRLLLHKVWLCRCVNQLRCDAVCYNQLIA